VAQARRFVSTEDELDQGNQERTLVVQVGVWNRAIGLAETQGFRLRGRHMHPSVAAAFAVAVKQALEQKPVPAGRRLSAITPAEQLTEFFDDPLNRKMLLRIVALAELGGGLDVVDG
jgi:hypothetical protein